MDLRMENPMETKRCVRVSVKGHVQGIGFRAATQKIAQKYGITGKAVNRKDGGVDVTACGEEDSIAKLVRWLHKGPDGASVDTVMVDEIDIASPKSFTIG
jgi:acylphosphatase